MTSEETEVLESKALATAADMTALSSPNKQVSLAGANRLLAEAEGHTVVAYVSRKRIKEMIRKLAPPVLVHSVNGVQEGVDVGTIKHPSADLLQSELAFERELRAVDGFSYLGEVVEANLPSSEVFIALLPWWRRCLNRLMWWR